MKTFADLYTFLRFYSKDSIIEWLEESWKGKDKQESLLRLFSCLGLVKKLNNFVICKGNFNEGTVTKLESFREIFYDSKNKLINLKDKGDKSDLHGKIEEKKIILATTSKNLDKESIGKLDLRDILQIHSEVFPGWDLNICLCVRDRSNTLEMVKRSESCNKDLKSLIQKETTIIIDWFDLDESFKLFREIFQDKELEDILENNKNPISFRMHQKYSILKTLKLKEDGKREILWGHIQRSGKSYIMAGTIIEDCKNKESCNYLVMTTAPNETIEQYLSVFNCFQLKKFNVIHLNGTTNIPKLTDFNIIVCSKQFLQNKLEEKNKRPIQWLKKIDFNIRFLDESHNGGTTDLAQKILNFYGKDSFTVQITATYSKPIQDYDIPKENWILWDLEDINICKNIDKKREQLIVKHGDIMNRVLEQYLEEDIMKEYSPYPELMIFTKELKGDILDKIIESTRNNNYGWSTESCFLLNETKDKFQNEEANLNLWYSIFGKTNFLNIPDDKYPDKDVFINRIEKIQKHSGEEPRVIIAFLPQNNIQEISNASKNLLEKYEILPNFEIVCTNSKTGKDPKELINDTVVKAKNSAKRNVLVLSGRQCSLGITIKNCDIVLLLNNNSSFDLIYQMMFRSMTERKDKKFGFVVDLNIHRVVEKTIAEYATLIKSELHPKEAIRYLLTEKIVNLNGDHWKYSSEDICESIYKIYFSNTEGVLKTLLDRLKNKNPSLVSEDQKIVNLLFVGKISGKKKKEEREDLVKKGIEKEKISEPVLKEEIVQNTNFMDVIRHLIPLICILTIKNKETVLVDMYNIIKEDKKLLEILLDQTKIWWGKIVESKIIENLITIYIKYMESDKETERIIRTVKELFIQNADNKSGLSKAIDTYLIPQELEKKNNAEFSTPYELRIAMLNKLPSKFWETPKKIFEPCSGKGGFLIDIIDKFMIGLKDLIPDEDERYKKIVEDCLYFSDINSSNIFICKLLVDPGNKFNLNYNEGNTLELNISEKWNIESFDAVVANPPYNNSSGVGGSKKLWDKFFMYSLNKCLKTEGYLLFINPPNWRKPENVIFKEMKKYNLISLDILDEDEGKKQFKCSTKADYYLLQKSTYRGVTLVNGKTEINIQDMNFIPNQDFDLFSKIRGTCDIVCPNTSYSSDMKWMKEDDKLKYKYILTKNSKETRYMYSELQKNYHGVKKVIVSSGRYPYPINDYNGELGMSCYNFGIVIESKEEGESILKCFDSEKFKNLLKNNKWGSYNIEWRMFKYFKKDFWKEFI